MSRRFVTDGRPHTCEPQTCQPDTCESQTREPQSLERANPLTHRLSNLATTTPDIRIAMWSGPRNLSTALMRSWGSRPDTAVVDEPFYACYLAATGREHPGRDEVLASQSTDWCEVAASLTGAVPGGRPVFYQKHMAHHLLPEMGRGWMDHVRHAFLVREPAAMLASLLRVWPDAQLADTGLPQQVDLFRRECDRLGHAPPVVDAGDLLADPAGALSRLCEALGVEFDPCMLSWSAGPRPEDGVWAPHWYASVYRSTGFDPPRTEGAAAIAEGSRGLLEECERLYAELRENAISAAPTAG